jgi:hypothetical protein
MLCLHYTICLMQLSVVRNLILMGCSGDIPMIGLLVIDTVGWRSMYFVVMPRVNLIVIFLTYHVYLYSINCPTIICLPSMCYLSYGETPPGPISIILLLPIYFTRTIYFTRILLLFSTRYAHNLCFKQTGEIDNLITSWEQSTWLCVCRFRIATGRRRVNKYRKWRPCWSAIKPVHITFSCLYLFPKND